MSSPVTDGFADGLSTYEGIVDAMVDELRRCGALAGPPMRIPWNSFLRLSDRIHQNYVIPSTSITAIMRRLLFGLGFGAQPRNLVAVGSFVGYALSWLLRDRADVEAAPFIDLAIAVDTDAAANEVARRNCAFLNHADRLTVVDGDGIHALERGEDPIDLLYLDLDDPVMGKAGYQQAVQAALPRLRCGCVLLAHDACVPKFEADIGRFHAYITGTAQFAGPWVLAVDECGLSVAVRR